jgi:hypothetical protein
LSWTGVSISMTDTPELFNQHQRVDEPKTFSSVS